MRQVLPKHVYTTEGEGTYRYFKFTSTDGRVGYYTYSYENSIDCDLVEAILRGDADKVREAFNLVQMLTQQKVDTKLQPLLYGQLDKATLKYQVF